MVKCALYQVKYLQVLTEYLYILSSTEYLTLEGLASFSCKWTKNKLSLVGKLRTLTTIQACCYSIKTAIDNIQMTMDVFQ